MRIYVAVTDSEWFTLHASTPVVDEVNFWRPSASGSFRALQAGEVLLFKLHAPDNYTAGGGFFTRFIQLPVSLAWDVFKEANGVLTLAAMRARIAHYRHKFMSADEDPIIGCIMLAEPFFWREDLWIPSPPDFKLNTVQGKGYDSETGVGRELWLAVSERLKINNPQNLQPDTATLAAIESGGFGKPHVILPRLGQGTFRILVTDVYDKRCAVTREKTLPALDAAHIQPYSVAQRHDLQNGLLMRSDLHRLFDKGYLTIDPSERKVLVSKRIKEEFENGRDYYALHGTLIRNPRELAFRPARENLEFHATHVFR
jgi:putative restriction endonuclease